MDLVGRTFGYLVVKKLHGRNKHKHLIYECLCKCGTICLRVSNALLSNNAKSCGCVNPSKDLTGKVFGELTVLNYHSRSKKTGRRWLCKCSCGNETIVTTGNLNSKHTKSCGCKNIGPTDMLGQHYDMLTVIAYAGSKRDKAHWLCKCDCGNLATVAGNSLRTKITTSCGCKRAVTTSKKCTKDMKGKIFNGIFIIKRDGTGNSGDARWNCQCHCGKFFTTSGASLRSGATASCGCAGNGYSRISQKFLEFLEKMYDVTIQRAETHKEFSIENKRFDGRYKNTLIETDGIYWHGTPEAKQNDDYKTKLAEENGFNLIRVQYLDTEKQIQPLYEKYKDQFDKAFGV